MSPSRQGQKERSGDKTSWKSADCQLPLTLDPNIKEGLVPFGAFYLCMSTIPNPVCSSILIEEGLEGTSAESP